MTQPMEPVRWAYSRNIVIPLLHVVRAEPSPDGVLSMLCGGTLTCHFRRTPRVVLDPTHAELAAAMCSVCLPLLIEWRKEKAA